MNIAKAIVFSGVIALSASGLAACSSTPDCQSLATQSGFELASAITPEKAGGGGGGGGGSKGGGTSSGSKGGSTVPKSGTNSQPKTNTTVPRPIPKAGIGGYTPPYSYTPPPMLQRPGSSGVSPFWMSMMGGYLGSSLGNDSGNSGSACY